MEGHAHPEVPTVPAHRLPDPREPIPVVAWPTVSLYLVAIALFGGFLYLGATGAVPAAIAVLVNAVASYMFFTVLHDASHRSISQHDGLNRWLGRLSSPFVAPPAASYSLFRYIHMQHHRFTNAKDESLDPDSYTSNGPAWTWPLRWATLDLRYYAYYLPLMRSRPRRELAEFAVTLVGVVGAWAVLVATGTLTLGGLLLFWILPTRLNVAFLGFAFDWLPHHGLAATPQDDRFKTTRNRVGLERLASPVLLYQNYHLVHHLHPLIPFYRYLAAWRRNEDAYLEAGTPLATWSGREVTPEDYRRQREAV